MKRQTAFFDAAGRKVEIYQMTKGQKLAMAAVNVRNQQAVIQRLWVILEALFVKSSDWRKFDDALVSGKIEYDAAEKFANDVIAYEWPEPQDEPDTPEVAPDTGDDYS